MRTIKFVCLLTLAISDAGETHAADPLARYDDHDISGSSRELGPTYVNNNYGYSVEIPAGQIGWTNTPPSPNHGVAIYLGSRRSIEVDASFDSAMLGSTLAVANAEAGYVSGAQNRKTQDTFGGRPGLRVNQVFPGSDRERIVVARWDNAGGPGDAINFVMTLETTKKLYVRDERTFNALVHSFRFTPRSP